MAEMLGLSVRLLVVRCLAFEAVRAETMVRVNAGAAGDGGQSQRRFQAVCVSTVSFVLQRRGFVYSGNWEGRMSVVYRARFVKRLQLRRLLSGKKIRFALLPARVMLGAQLFGRY